MISEHLGREMELYKPVVDQHISPYDWNKNVEAFNTDFMKLCKSTQIYINEFLKAYNDKVRRNSAPTIKSFVSEVKQGMSVAEKVEIFKRSAIYS